MTRITDYATLKTAVLAALERELDEQAIGLFDEWVQLTEDELADVLRAPWLVRVATFDYNPPDPMVGFEYLPVSFVEMIAITPLDGGKPLDPIDSAALGEYLKRYGQPRVYCVEGYTLWIGPPAQATDPPVSTTYRMSYYTRSEPLTEENTINDIIKNRPLLYKYGCIRHAKVFYGEDSSIDDAVFMKMVESSNAMSAPWRRGIGAKVRVR